MNESIINGIDVSECEHHYTNLVNGTIYHGCAIYEQINELGYSQDTLCEQNPDCYFKQFKRLQKENEELKARLKTLDDEVLTIEITPDEFERYKKYKQALEEIKIAIRQKLQEHKDVRDFINPSIEDGKAFVFQEGYIAALESVIGLIERLEK